MTEIEIIRPETTAAYTDAQATDEALLMFTRRMRRLHPDAYEAVLHSLSQGIRDALTLADNRADLLRATDQRDGITRHFVTISDRVEMELDAEDEQYAIEN